jgi:hypothetical protein
MGVFEALLEFCEGAVCIGQDVLKVDCGVLWRDVTCGWRRWAAQSDTRPPMLYCYTEPR